MIKYLVICFGLIPNFANAQTETTLLARSTQIITELAKELKFSHHESTILYIRNDILNGKLRRIEEQISEISAKQSHTQPGLTALNLHYQVDLRRVPIESTANILNMHISLLEQKLRIFKKRLKEPVGLVVQ